MLEFLRRHSQTIMIVTVVVIISFMFWGGTAKTGVRGGEHAADQTAFTIYGRDYSFDDEKRLSSLEQLCMIMRLYQFSRALGSYSTTVVSVGQQYQADFIFNLLVLRHELERYGIHASDAEIKEEYKQLPLFQSGGAYNPATAEMFEQHLSAFGMKSDDVYELLGDVVGWRKLQEVVAGNIVPSPQLDGMFYASYYQTIKASQIPFLVDDFKKTVQVTEEESKKYYEQKKDEYKNPEKRSAAYIFFQKPQNLDKATEEERRAKNNDFGKAVNDFSTASLKPGANFDELAKDAIAKDAAAKDAAAKDAAAKDAAPKDGKLELKTLPAFAQADPPEAIKSESSLVAEIFRLDLTSHPVSGPVEGKDGYYIVHLLTVEPKKQQEFKEVEAKIKATLIDQKSQEAMMKAASDARKNLETALSGGKKFEDAAKALNLTPKAIPDFSPAEPPKDVGGAQEIAEESRKTPAGKFLKPVQTDHGVSVVYVAAKELRKRDDSATLKENIRSTLDSVAQEPVFRAWFGKRKEEAKINSDPIVRRESARQPG